MGRPGLRRPPGALARRGRGTGVRSQIRDDVRSMTALTGRDDARSYGSWHPVGARRCMSACQKAPACLAGAFLDRGIVRQSVAPLCLCHRDHRASGAAPAVLRRASKSHGRPRARRRRRHWGDAGAGRLPGGMGEGPRCPWAVGYGCCASMRCGSRDDTEDVVKVKGGASLNAKTGERGCGTGNPGDVVEVAGCRACELPWA